MTHRDDLGIIRTELEKGLFEVVFAEIEKRGVERKKIPHHIQEKLYHSVTRESVISLSVVLKMAIEEMTRTGLMEEFP